MNKLFRFFMFFAIPLSVLVVSCKDDEDGGMPATQEPNITSVSPDQALPGTSVTITGTNLADATSLRFGNTDAEISSNTPTTISTTVPQAVAAGSQQISLTTAGGTATFAFTVLEETVAAPTIVSFSPEEGAVGEEITITGTDFVEDDILTVWIGEVEVTTFAVVDESTITFTVPEGAESGTVRINLMQGDPVVSPAEFTVTGTGGPQARVYNNIVLRAVGDRFEDGHHTAFNATDGTTHHYTEGHQNGDVSAEMDFMMGDSNGEDRHIIISPSHTWLDNNFFKGEVEWPVRNQTMFVVLNREQYDEAFFTAADYEAIAALELDEEEARERKDWLEEGDIVLFESQSGNKGLIFIRDIDPNEAAENPAKKDIYTIDVRVITVGEEQ